MHTNQSFLSVITRTRSREVTLDRLMKNLSQQIFKDFEWIIVNDGGDKSIVDEVVKQSLANKVSTIVIHNETSQGRSMAANIGVNAATGKYVLILDDDDYTDPKYFQKIYDFFSKSPTCKAVTCWSDIIWEELNGKEIVQHGLYGSFKPGVANLSIINLHTHNIPTCGLVVLRDLFLKVGGYPEGVNYTEDWAFVCKIIIEVNIDVIPEVLAYISRRKNPVGFYKNTTSDAAGINGHLEDQIKWQNDKIRDSLKMNNSEGLAILFGSLNWQIQEIAKTMHKIETMLNKVFRLSGAYYVRLFVRKIKYKLRNSK